MPEISTSDVGKPVTRLPRHRPGRAVFPHPVPRLHSLSRRTERRSLRYAKTACFPLFSVTFGQAMFNFSSVTLNCPQLKLRRFPPLRFSHL